MGARLKVVCYVSKILRRIGESFMYVRDGRSSWCASNVCCGIYIQGREGRRQRERGKKGGREKKGEGGKGEGKEE